MDVKTEDLLNVKTGIDAFTDELTGDDAKGKIHIRIHQRNGRKSNTTLEGLDDDLDLKRICKAFKKNFNCNGHVVGEGDGEVIQLQGDQRENIKQFLIDQEICEEDRIVIHGF